MQLEELVDELNFTLAKYQKVFPNFPRDQYFQAHIKRQRLLFIEQDCDGLMVKRINKLHNFVPLSLVYVHAVARSWQACLGKRCMHILNVVRGPGMCN